MAAVHGFALLLLLRRLRNHYMGFHALAAAALADAPHRRCVQIIASDRQPAVRADRGSPVGDIEALPAPVLPEPDVHPGMAGRIIAVAGEDVPAHVAGREANRPGRGEEQVGLVLAHAGAAVKDSRRRILHVTRARVVTDLLHHRSH